MATGDQFVSISPKRLLGFLDFRDRWLNYFKKIFEDITENAFAQNGFFNAAVTMSAFGPDKIQVDNDIVGTDAQGHFLLTNEALAGRAPSGSGIPVENTLAVTYSVALIYAEKPSGTQINPRTGFPEFLRIDEHIGVRDEPDLVTDHGDGTMTFRVNSVARPFAADVSNALDQTGRKVLVWKKSPGRTAVTEGAAILEGTISLVGGNNEITVGTAGVDPFGQTPGQASVNTSDYFVLLEGPTVSRQDLSVEPFTLFIGTFDGAGAGNNPTAFSISGQNTLSSVASDLGQVTAPHHGNLKIRTRADAADIDESQIEVQDAGAVPRFTVDEDGDTNISGTLDVQGLATLLNALISNLTISGDLSAGGETGLGGAVSPGKALKTHGNTEIGADELDAHTLYGDLTLQDNALTPNVVIDGQFGQIDVGQAAGSGGIKNNLDTRLLNYIHAGLNINGGTAFQASRFPRIDFGDLNSLSILNQLLQWTGFSGEFTSPTTRVFGHRNGEGGWITINANYDGGNATPFFKDQANDIAIGIELIGANGTQGNLRVYTHDPTSTSAWAAWDNLVLSLDLDAETLTSLPDIGTALNLVNAAQLALNGLGGELLILQPPGGVGAILQLGGTAAADWESLTPGMPINIDGDLHSVAGNLVLDAGSISAPGAGATATVDSDIVSTNGDVSAGDDLLAGDDIVGQGDITVNQAGTFANFNWITSQSNIQVGAGGSGDVFFDSSNIKTGYRWLHGIDGVMDQFGNPFAPGGAGLGARDPDNDGVAEITGPDTTSLINHLRLEQAGTGSGIEVHWPIQIPNGSTITLLEGAFDNTNGGTVFVEIRRVNITQTASVSLRAAGVVALPVYDVTTAGLLHSSFTPDQNNLINNSIYRYYVRLLWLDIGANGPDRYFGWRVRYTTTSLPVY